MERRETDGLEGPLVEEEVFTALSNLIGDIDPSLDGFFMVFWQFSWNFLKGEMMGFFSKNQGDWLDLEYVTQGDSGLF